MWRWSIGWGRSNHSTSSSRQGSRRSERVGERLGVGDLGHGELVLEAHLVVVERGRHVEDGPPVLNGHDPPGGERPAVADPVDLVEDRDLRVARAQEVRVQRMDPPVLDGAARRDQGLGGHLAPEDPLALLVGLRAPEDVHLNGLEVEQVDEELEGRAHRPMIAGGVARRGPGGRATGPLPCGAMATARDHDGPERWRSPTGSPGAWPPRPTRSRAATSTTTGGRGSTTPIRGPCAPSGDACDSFTPLARGRGPGGRARPVRLPLLARMEPDRTGRGGVLRGRPRALPADLRRLPSGGGSVPVVTFHHFTTPLWLAARGGWEAPDAPDCFARFVTRAAAHLGDLIGWACTINEPNVVAVMGYFQGQYPPGVKDDFAAVRRGERGHGAGPSSGGGRAAVRTRGLPRGAHAVDGRDRRRRGR